MGISVRFALWLNGVPRNISEQDAHRPLSSWLRSVCHLSGTKVACGAGECGACTVLVARPASPTTWMPVNSCLLLPAQLHGCHVRTVEGISQDGALSPVQEALVTGHGLQCGFCTPGFVVTMTGALHAQGQVASEPLDRAAWRDALAGNLCRCTGYDAILAAGEAAARGVGIVTAAGALPVPVLHEVAWAASTLAGDDSVDEEAADECAVWRPRSLMEALRMRERAPERVIIAGGTDVMPSRAEANDVAYPCLLVGHLPELQGCVLSPEDGEGRRTLRIGGACTWTDLGAVVAGPLPQVGSLIERVGNPQTRNVATIGGQIATASSIGDLLPLLLVLDATVTMSSATHARELSIDAFLHDPSAALHGALLTAITVRLPSPHGALLVEKASRRRDADVATIAVAAYVEVRGTRVVQAALAVGGAGPRAQRLTQAEQRLVGATIGEEAAKSAAQAAETEVSPWSDVRASAAHRRALVTGLIHGMLMDVARAPSGSAL
jgi:xanthine dehydrogenase small subunit